MSNLTERFGYVVVPVLLTQAMLDAGLNARNPELQLHLSGSGEANRMRRQVERMWRAMLAAAPVSEALGQMKKEKQ